MRPILCVAARGIIRDAASNNVSIFSILEELRPDGFPSLLSEVQVLGLWAREPGDPEVTNLTLRIANNEIEVLRSDLSVQFQTSTRHRSIVTIGTLVIQQPGQLTFTFRRGDDLLASYTIAINAPAQQAAVENVAAGPAAG
jgi:hypothetical protein